jgi:hypothetical protein
VHDRVYFFVLTYIRVFTVDLLKPEAELQAFNQTQASSLIYPRENRMRTLFNYVSYKFFQAIFQ